MISFLFAWLTSFPLTAKFLLSQLDDENYQFCAPYLVFLIWLGWGRIKPLEIPEFRLKLPNLLVLMATWIVLALAIALDVPKAGYLGWVLCGFLGCTLFLPQNRLLPLLPIFLASLLVIPLPFGLLEKTTSFLQGQVVWVAHQALLAFNILHNVTGNVILLADRPLLVAEACSGIRSLVSIIALSICYNLYRSHSWPRSLALLLLSLIVVLFLNLFRILFIVLILSIYGVDFTMGWKHEALGILCFVVALMVIIGSDSILEGFKAWITGIPAGTPSAEDGPLETIEETKGKLEPRFSNYKLGFFGWILAACFLPLFLLQAKILATEGVAFMEGGGNTHLPLLAGKTNLTDLAGWKLVQGPEVAKDEKILGQGVQSQFWVYQKLGMTARISIDEPFRGFHDLSFCYRNVGWDQKDPNNPAPHNGKFAVESGFFKAPNLHLLLYFGHVDTAGNWIAPRSSLGSYLDTIRDRLARNFLGVGPRYTGWNYQVQLSCITGQQLSSLQKNELKELFEEFRSRVEQFPEIVSLQR